MAMREELESVGNWLFRWRSYLPFLLLIPLALSLEEFVGEHRNERLRNVWEAVCFGCSLLGLGIRAVAVGQTPARTSGRNTARQLAASLNTSGLYSVVRHPLYLGNFLIWLGIALFIRSWELTLIFCLGFWVYYERIMFAEEEFLRREFGEEFLAWAKRTPAFIPNLSLWRPAELPFSFRTALRKEYTGLFGIGVAFVLLDLMENAVIEGRFSVDLQWIVVAVTATVVSATLRMLKKNSQLLDVDGR